MVQLRKRMKTIYEYENYREYLKDFYVYAKATKKGFSFRSFSKSAGFASPGVLKRVMSGERNLSVQGILKFALALKLNKEETQFFKNLVLFNQATTAEEKHNYARHIMRSHKFKKIHPLSEAQFNYFSRWYMIAIRELVALSTFKEDPEWIACEIDPPITPELAQKALQDLLTLGLIERSQSGKLQVTNANVSTSDEVSSNVIAQIHRELTNKAMESMDRVPREHREISALAMGVSEETMKKVKERIQLFRKELVDLVSQDETPDMVYQLNFQFFPLTQTGRKLK
jgi:uncharacterized protein (TIGR02147 family)